MVVTIKSKLIRKLPGQEQFIFLFHTSVISRELSTVVQIVLFYQGLNISGLISAD